MVNDDPDNLRLTLEILSNHGIELVSARNGADGLRIATHLLPDLILLDTRLPDMDGFEVCRLLQTRPSTQLIPVIFLTAHGKIEDKMTGFAVGGVDYVTTPFDARELLLRITNHLRIARSAQRNSAIESNFLPAACASRDADANTTNCGLDMLVRARDHLNADLANPPDLTKLAHLVGTNRTTLQRLFQEHLGMSIFAYLREQRLLQARKLIDAGADRLDIVAGEVGYANARDLTRAFKLRFGLTPSSYAKGGQQ